MLLPVLQKYLELEETGKAEYLCFCPFHDDQNKKSCSVNIAKRLFFCHACGEKGSIVKLLSKCVGQGEPLVKYELNFLYRDLKQQLPDFDPLPYVKALHKNQKMLDFLVNERLWSLEVIQDYMIGFDSSKQRITIPVTNIFQQIVNVRYYKPKAKKDEAKVINYPGFGKARLFNIKSLAFQDVLLLEGEPDCLAAISGGRRALSSTAGAQHFDSAWNDLFRERTVYICYDADRAGIDGAAKVVRKLSSCSCRVVTLPDGQDYTDYHLTSDHNFDRCLEEAVEAHVAKEDKREDSEDQQIFEVSLAESSKEEYFRRLVSMKVMISGKTLSPYIIPKVIRASCSLPGLKICAGCGLQHHSGEQTIALSKTTAEILQLVETTIDNHQRIFKEMCQIPSRCKIAMFEILEAQNIEEIKVIPELDFSLDESEYVLRQAYYIGHGLKPNNTYKLTGLTLPHPKTQQVTYLISVADALEDTISSFKITDELVKELRVFSIEQNGKDTGET